MPFNQSLGSFFSFWENFPASVSKAMNNDSVGSNLHDQGLLQNASNVHRAGSRYALCSR